MSSLAQLVAASHLKDRIFNERQLGAVAGGSEARRYGLVNRALGDGSLIRLKRGTYMLGGGYHGEAAHPFAIAQSLVPGSYVSFESALAHHGWIPEAVFVTASVTPGRKTQTFDTPDFGQFGFHPLALGEYRFLVGVDRVPFNSLVAFVAQPLRALMDLVALRKLRWSGLEWLVNGMRIDEDLLLTTRRKDFAALKPVYRHQATNDFLSALENALQDAGGFQTRSRHD
jgi:hypothetical protein